MAVIINFTLKQKNVRFYHLSHSQLPKQIFIFDFIFFQIWETRCEVTKSFLLGDFNSKDTGSEFEFMKGIKKIYCNFQNLKYYDTEIN